MDPFTGTVTTPRGKHEPDCAWVKAIDTSQEVFLTAANQRHICSYQPHRQGGRLTQPSNMISNNKEALLLQKKKVKKKNNNKKTTRNNHRFFNGPFIFFGGSSCNLFEAIERFTIVFLKHIWSSNKKEREKKKGHWHCISVISQVFCLRITNDIHNVVSFQMLTNKYGTSVDHPVCVCVCVCRGGNSFVAF